MSANSRQRATCKHVLLWIDDRNVFFAVKNFSKQIKLWDY
ncbi:hypothetical protein M089_4285 [Bacteroides ovatus str. 3725 D9 iii]|uniref:NYN domain-containing protein n=1 Tax=Bacteroides uniformis (strain ATCC 8492 / DSM 6597 / CCUG 4942 / CIP 103695 / JCM 5828 / KCTC 5204 / NCTC 13054 / VPI 0061) TaxID=411479 RepID=A0ABC9N5Z1_BACUC|nr:hypothetical protein BACUNI_04492 [Bacteroides uniformis ATCC 8492]KDS16327.1 hypothetical protein M082_4556 [Bacteroides fragilis str. 3725 D9 ii]KDS23712.1 hypothetical protein M088_5415 [Bacteroides ovatus str. 3725 D1 iv]KDS26095.1 hypothetical protein M089_4285 [Bacteroides ovatus str. 3725 D9 iii]